MPAAEAKPVDFISKYARPICTPTEKWRDYLESLLCQTTHLNCCLSEDNVARFFEVMSFAVSCPHGML